MARKKKEESGGGGEGWLATFADLMNLLLCFFVLLFASSTVDTEKYDQIVSSFSSSFSIFTDAGEGIGEGNMISNGASQLNNLDSYYNSMGKSQEDSKEENDPLKEYKKEQEKIAKENYSKLKKEIKNKKLDKVAKVEIDKNYNFVKILFSGSFLFDSGKADLRPEGYKLITEVGDILKKFEDYKIVIEGHTDNVPMHTVQFPSNLWLSTARATTVLETLIDKKGLNPKGLIASGRSEYDPIDTNDTVEGRARNRRAEIKIYNDKVGD